ncbi:MAG: hypothetical protein KDE09_01635 [Anaerolineales bacterium]|nr:hypothetical protein [Anaerolineales bacterium]MCB0028352.1 hypothetical protein [Anaerolineales bacterium]
MSAKLSFQPIALTIFVFLLASYLLCIAVGLLFGWGMVDIWGPLLPGFTWPLSTGGFFLGLLWVFIYSLYSTTLIVFPYNYFVTR